MNNPHVDFTTRYMARIGDQYIHHSLECLTPHKSWAWKPTGEQLRKAKRKVDLVKRAKVVRILRNIKLKSGGVVA